MYKILYNKKNVQGLFLAEESRGFNIEISS